MQEQLVELQAELGKTIVFITHDLNEAMFLGDRIAVMRDGRIVQIGTPEDILTDPANDYVAQFVQDVDRARVLTAASVMEPARAVVAAHRRTPRGACAPCATCRPRPPSSSAAAGSSLGAVRDRDVLRAGARGRDATSRAVVPPTSSTRRRRDAALVDLVEPAVESDLPLAVVDDERPPARRRSRGSPCSPPLGNVSTDTGEIAGRRAAGDDPDRASSRETLRGDRASDRRDAPPNASAPRRECCA